MSFKLLYILSSKLPNLSLVIWLIYNPREKNFLKKCYPEECPKVSVIVWLEFKLIYCNSPVQCFNYYTTKIFHISEDFSLSVSLLSFVIRCFFKVLMSERWYGTLVDDQRNSRKRLG